MKLKLFTHSTFWLCYFFLSGCLSQPATPVADLIVLDGRIFTGTNQEWAQAMAIKEGRIVFVGDNVGAKRYQGPDSTVLNLENHMAMPGIIDAHIHPIWGMLAELFQCRFAFSATPKEVQQTVATCVSAQSDRTWIQGGQWDSGFFETFDLASPRSHLDQVSGDKAVYLGDDSGHNAWVNSKALEIAGITKDTKDPPGGVIVRDSDGEPNGVLLETAANLFNDILPKNSARQIDQAAIAFADYAHGYGITGIKPAAIRERHIAGLQRVDLKGELNLHVATAIRTQEGTRTKPLDYEHLERIRDQYQSPNVHTAFIKLFLDGVPTTARTAGMLAHYTPEKPGGETTDGGDLLIGTNALTTDLMELDRRGFTVKIHTAGDRSVRVALDAIEQTRQKNGNQDRRHELAHAGYVSDSDMPRFQALNAVPDFSPILWHPSPIIQNVLMAVGEKRGRQYWPVKSLLETGAYVLAGSDWPSAVPDANPWVGIEAFVTRKNPRNNGDQALWSEQKITLDQALDIYTQHGAHALRLGDQTGSLAVGKLADFIVLNQNLFEVSPETISETLVLKTFFKGNLVYDREQ